MEPDLPPLFSTAHARSLGLSPGEIRRLPHRRPAHGVRVAAEQSSLAVDCAALLHVLPAGSAVSHVSALRLWGADLPWPLEAAQRIPVLTTQRSWRPHRHDVVAHYCGQAHLGTTTLDGVVLTTPEQTWLHLSPQLPLNELIVLGDALVRRTNPLSTLSAMANVIDKTHKMKGLARARAALPRCRTRTDSNQESRLRLLLEDAELAVPTVNHLVYDGETFIAMVDLSYPDLKIAIEYDGDVHRTKQLTWSKDIDRRESLRAHGWIVLVVEAGQFRDYPERIVARVRAAIRERQAQLLR